MFEKTKYEKCGQEYRGKTISENRGKHYCKDCLSHCQTCGTKLPMSNWLGQTGSVTGAFLGPLAGSLEIPEGQQSAQANATHASGKNKKQRLKYPH